WRPWPLPSARMSAGTCRRRSSWWCWAPSTPPPSPPTGSRAPTSSASSSSTPACRSAGSSRAACTGSTTGPSGCRRSPTNRSSSPAFPPPMTCWSWWAAGRASTPRWCPTAPSAARCRAWWTAPPEPAAPRNTVLRERIVCWTLIGLALAVSVVATLDARGRVGTTYPGFAVMEQLLVAPGGVEKGGLLPFDLVRAINGQLVTSGREVHDEVRRHPVGTRFQYLLSRRGALHEAEIASRVITAGDLRRYVIDGLFPSLLYLGLAAVVLALRPGVPETRVFLFFALTWFCTAGLFPDSWTTYRFSALFLTAWAFAPAAYLHIALRFPRPRPVLFRHPWLLRLAYLASGVIALAIQLPMTRMPAAWPFLVPAVAATYWALAFIVLVGSLVHSALRSPSPLMRQRAKVLTAGFVAGPL